MIGLNDTPYPERKNDNEAYDIVYTDYTNIAIFYTCK